MRTGYGAGDRGYFRDKGQRARGVVDSRQGGDMS